MFFNHLSASEGSVFENSVSLMYLCFFSRGIPNYDFKIGRITFIRNSRPLVKKVEEVSKVGCCQLSTELEGSNCCPSLCFLSPYSIFPRTLML